jgi:hypothetical protein
MFDCMCFSMRSLFWKKDWTVLMVVMVLWSNLCQESDVFYSIGVWTCFLSSCLFVLRMVSQHAYVSSSAHLLLLLSVMRVRLSQLSSLDVYSDLFAYEHGWTISDSCWLDQNVLFHQIQPLISDRLRRWIIIFFSSHQYHWPTCSSLKWMSSI